MINTDKYEGHTPAEEWGDIVYAHGYLPIFLDDDVYSTDIDRQLMTDAPKLLAEVKRLSEIEQEWLMMWATLEELNLVADVRKNMTEHGFTFPTDEDVIE